jgi:RNA polymerase sigma-70 factor (ECF subfamily)
VLSQSKTRAQLLEGVAEGDESAWREFCARYEELIRCFAQRRGLQPADCDDAMQEVLTSLTKSMPGFCYDPAKGKFRSYLKTIVLHAITRKSFQKQGQVALEEVEEATTAAAQDPEVEQVWEEEWQEYHLRQAMRTVEAEFNEADRAAFQAYAVEGRTAAETAEMLGMNPDQVYKAKSRILKRVTALIEQQVREEG